MHSRKLMSQLIENLKLKSESFEDFDIVVDADDYNTLQFMGGEFSCCW